MRIGKQVRANRHRELRTDLTALRTEAATHRTELATLRAESATAQAELATLRAESATAQAELATLRAESATAQAELATLRAESAAVRAELAGLRAESAALRAEVAAVRVAVAAPDSAGPADGRDDLAERYLAWRSGPLVRIGKALARRAGPTASGDQQPVRWRGAAMRALCLALLDPAVDAQDRHRHVGDAVTELLGDTGWRNDADLIRALIDVRDGATPLTAAVRPGDWTWPSPGGPIDHHDVLPGSDGTRVALVVAPALRTVPPLIVAG
ncbi:ribosomal protein L29 [Catenuloplanes nepalensis]|uniref:Ribosomal protein L29 n=1 Tax=Catenuloplanes nepalensis TaxID=587533 RepID=A0ABT9MR24_9ACTN|nr:hypothetical protein [Catenuloplanes nepalensis]MDP9793884.1 ribosomal protein L29 [Catenuloplanes nepalensis]